MTQLYEGGGSGPLKPITTTERGVGFTPITKRAKVAATGTIAQCLGGDVVDVGHRNGWQRCSVAWTWPDGSAMVRIDCSNACEALRFVPARVPVRFIELRCK